MSVIIDKRSIKKGRLAGSRAKFIDRYKDHIRQKIDDHILDTNTADIGESGVPININKKEIDEVEIHYDRNSEQQRILSGNDRFSIGDKWKEYKDNNGRSTEGEDGEDDFTFCLTKEEFLNILFEDMGLPNFIKKNNNIQYNTKLVTGGYVKSGVPSRLAIKKTMEVAAGRRYACRNLADDRKPRFIDESDLRYRHVIEQNLPVSKAVVFFVMDISGSMTEERKLIAKKFFLFFYLFLTKCYEHLEIRFIAHTTEAFETDESKFFYSMITGGTIVSTAIELVNDIIRTDYDVDQVNIYVAQASDGENNPYDDDKLYGEVSKLLPTIQYFAYIEIESMFSESGVAKFYNTAFEGEEKLQTAIIEYEEDILKALKMLFKKGDK